MSRRCQIQPLFFLLIFFLAFLPACLSAQGLQFKVDSTWNLNPDKIFISRYLFSIFDDRKTIIERQPFKEDAALLKENRLLIKGNPDFKNYDLFSALAAAVWRAGRTADAKRMFLKIENSKELYYTGTIFHSAGNTYEYGSFTSNYKNEACIFLTKIFIEERNYTAALAYLIKADKKYKIRYNCGTGQNSYMGELKNLYALCYEGLGLFDKSIDLHFSEIFYGDSKLIRLLKNKYNSNDLRRWLKSAKGNIILTKNTSPTIVYTTDEQTNEMKEVRRYTSGTASTVLFGRKVILPSPPDLENGQTVSRQDFIKEFIESDFYHSLYYGK